MTINYNLKEMKIKYVLTAMAIPAMFAACSQDEFLSEVNNSQNNLLGTPVKVDFVLNEDPQTRVDWGFTGDAEWDAKDQFSLFWHGSAANTAGDGSNYLYQGQSNAIYTRNESGVFTTPAITYVGSQVIVFPADLAHVTSKAIEVSIPAEQKGEISLGNRSVFVSDEIELKAPTTTPQAGEQYAGYNQSVSATLYPLSSNLALNLNFVMTDKIEEVTVKKVTLKVTPNAAGAYTFATKGNLYKNTETVGQGTEEHTAFVGTADANEISVEMPASTVVTKANNICQAQIAFLPVTATTLANNDAYAIIVETNYGIVTINKAALVTNNEQEIQTVDGPVALTDSNKDADLSFKTELDLTDTWSTASSSYGRRIVRDVTVNMAEAEIDGMIVSNSAELLDAYHIYDILGKGNAASTRVVNFQLNESVENGDYFNLTKEAYQAIAAHPYVTLGFETVTEGIRLVNEANAAFEAIPDLTTALDASSNKTLVLGAGNWTLDVNNDGEKVAQKNSTNNDIFNLLSNEGTLALKATTGTKILTTELKNLANGVINITNNLNLKVNGYSQAANSSLIIPQNVTLTISNGVTNRIYGSAAIDGRLIVDQSSTVLNFASGATATVNGSLLQSNNGQINNGGTITLGENGAVIMNNNINVTVGSIVLNNRDNQVSTSTNEGYIKLAWSESTFTPASTDAFNYLILQNNIDLSDVIANSGIDYFEIPEGKTVAVTYKATSPQTFEKVFVKKNATLRVPVGSAITATNTENDGAIEVYGDYTPGNKTGNGVIYEFK